MQRYCRVISAITTLNNIDLITNNEVKQSMRTLREELLAVDNIAQYFDIYPFENSYIYLLKKTTTQSLVV